MKELEKYIENTLGEEAKIIAVLKSKMQGLPFFIVNNYKLYSLELFGREIILVEVKTKITAEQLRKHIDIVQQAFQRFTVAVLQPIESYNRLRLIQKRVPFIISGKQMFMPQLFIDIKEFGTYTAEKMEVMQPAAQMLLLYHIQVESLEGINLKTIASRLGYNAATISRAMKYLLMSDLCNLKGSKDKYLHVNFSKKELWEKANPLMLHPVKRTIFYSGIFENNQLIKTNINALSDYSDLNPTAMQYYAARPGYIQWLTDEYPNQTGNLEGDICIEEWKYDPQKLTNNNTVDKLSLYLCLRDRKDERVQDALEQLIATMPW